MSAVRLGPKVPCVTLKLATVLVLRDFLGSSATAVNRLSSSPMLNPAAFPVTVMSRVQSRPSVGVTGSVTAGRV